jgi:hypothetical protein
MHGIAFINDDMYYERPDGTYAKMPYSDAHAVSQILIKSTTDDELSFLASELLKLLRERDAEKADSLIQSLG